VPHDALATPATGREILAAAGEPAISGPLATFIGATHDAVHEVPEVPERGYRAMARLSGHLAAMWRTVYPRAAGQPGAGGPLRAACLHRAREVEWVLRHLECQLSGDISGAGLPLAATRAALARRLDSYQAAERALVSWLEDQLDAEHQEKLARKYRRALGRAPTRPHPRCARSGPLGRAAFWLHGRWDRFLDAVDSRPGVGHDYRLALAQPPGGSPQPSAGAGPAA